MPLLNAVDQLNRPLCDRKSTDGFWYFGRTETCTVAQFLFTVQTKRAKHRRVNEPEFQPEWTMILEQPDLDMSGLWKHASVASPGLLRSLLDDERALADVGIIGSSGRTVIFEQLPFRNPNAVGGDGSVQCEDGMCTLIQSAAVCVTEVDESGRTLLHKLCADPRPDILIASIEALLGRNEVDLHIRDKSGLTAIDVIDHRIEYTEPWAEERMMVPEGAEPGHRLQYTRRPYSFVAQTCTVPPGHTAGMTFTVPASDAAAAQKCTATALAACCKLLKRHGAVSFVHETVTFNIEGQQIALRVKEWAAASDRMYALLTTRQGEMLRLEGADTESFAYVQAVIEQKAWLRPRLEGPGLLRTIMLANKHGMSTVQRSLADDDELVGKMHFRAPAWIEPMNTLYNAPVVAAKHVHHKYHAPPRLRELVVAGQSVQAVFEHREMAIRRQFDPAELATIGRWTVRRHNSDCHSRTESRTFRFFPSHQAHAGSIHEGIVRQVQPLEVELPLAKRRLALAKSLATRLGAESALLQFLPRSSELHAEIGMLVHSPPIRCSRDWCSTVSCSHSSPPAESSYRVVPNAGATDDETGIEGNSFSSDRNPFRGHALRLEAGVFEAGVAGMHEKAFFVSARRVEDWSPIFAGWNGQSYRRHRWVLSAE